MQSATNKSIANKVIIQAVIGSSRQGNPDNARTGHQLLRVLTGLAVFLMLIRDSEISS